MPGSSQVYHIIYEFSIWLSCPPYHQLLRNDVASGSRGGREVCLWSIVSQESSDQILLAIWDDRVDSGRQELHHFCHLISTVVIHRVTTILIRRKTNDRCRYKKNSALVGRVLLIYTFKRGNMRARWSVVWCFHIWTCKGLLIGDVRCSVCENLIDALRSCWFQNYKLQ